MRILPRGIAKELGALFEHCRCASGDRMDATLPSEYPRVMEERSR